MKVDVDQSAYREVDDVTTEFSTAELRRARLLLRRLRFLEDKVRENQASGDTSSGAMFAVWEVEALEWALGPDGLNFIEAKTDNRQKRNAS